MKKIILILVTVFFISCGDKNSDKKIINQELTPSRISHSEWLSSTKNIIQENNRLQDYVKANLVESINCTSLNESGLARFKVKL